jgi:hypothetical protein
MLRTLLKLVVKSGFLGRALFLFILLSTETALAGDPDLRDPTVKETFDICANEYRGMLSRDQGCTYYKQEIKKALESLKGWEKKAKSLADEKDSLIKQFEADQDRWLKDYDQFKNGCGLVTASSDYCQRERERLLQGDKELTARKNGLQTRTGELDLKIKEAKINVEKWNSHLMTKEDKILLYEPCPSAKELRSTYDRCRQLGNQLLGNPGRRATSIKMSCPEIVRVNIDQAQCFAFLDPPPITPGAGEYTFSWYLDGQFLSKKVNNQAAYSDITFNVPKKLGTHKITVDVGVCFLNKKCENIGKHAMPMEVEGFYVQFDLQDLETRTPISGWITLDDGRRGRTPFLVDKIGTEPHSIMIESPGYVTEIRQATFKSNANVTYWMAKAKSAGPVKSSGYFSGDLNFELNGFDSHKRIVPIEGWVQFQGITKKGRRVTFEKVPPTGDKISVTAGAEGYKTRTVDFYCKTGPCGIPSGGIVLEKN